MDPVLVTAMATVVVGGLSGLALVISSRSNSTSTATAALIEGQGIAITRMEAQIAARDSTIEDLRAQYDDCESKHRSLTVEFQRQGQELEAAKESIELQGAELARLKVRITELGDERLP